MNPPPPLEDLMSQFKFGPEDLVANRRGELSRAQVARLEARYGLVQRVFWGIGAMITLLLVITTVISLNAGNGALAAGMVVMMGALLAVIVLIARRMTRALRRDLANGTVAAITGPGRAFAVGHVHGRLYYLRVGDQRFEITIRQYMALKDVDSAIYTAYYAPDSWVLLSLEPGEPT